MGQPESVRVIRIFLLLWQNTFYTQKTHKNKYFLYMLELISNK
jgi:hypothetical protein